MTRSVSTHSRGAASDGRGFTLVELLVVVAIISLLLAILLPALEKARDEAKRVVCMSQLHQLMLAQLQYASDQQRTVTPHCGWDITNIFSTSFGNSWPGAVDGWTGLGLLWHFEYLTAPRLMWCPASTNPKLAFDDAPPTVTMYGHGWRENPPAGGARWMAQPTMQRFYVKRIDSNDFPPRSGFYSDAFFSGGFANGPAVDFYHKTGYNVVRLDGSTFYYNDGPGEIATLGVPQGQKQNGACFDIQESVFADYFDR